MKDKFTSWNSFGFLAVFCVIVRQCAAVWTCHSDLLNSVFCFVSAIGFSGIFLYLGVKEKERAEQGGNNKYKWYFLCGAALAYLLMMILRVLFGMSIAKAGIYQNPIGILLVILFMLSAISEMSGIGRSRAAMIVLTIGSLILCAVLLGLKVLPDWLTVCYQIPFFFAGMLFASVELDAFAGKSFMKLISLGALIGVAVWAVMERSMFEKVMNTPASYVVSAVLLFAIYSFFAAGVAIFSAMGKRCVSALIVLPMAVQFLEQGWLVEILQTITKEHWILLYTLLCVMIPFVLCAWTMELFVRILMFPLTMGKGTGSRFSTMFKTMVKYRFLLMELVKKGIVLKYRRSFLGILWSLIEPLLTMMVLSYVFGNFFGGKEPLYSIYILTGRLMFTLFQNTTKEALRSVRSNASMIKKVYVPKYMYPISTIFYNFILFLISLIDLVLVMAYYKFIRGLAVPITFHLLESFLPIFVLLLFSVGIGMILATVNVFFRDIEYLWNVFCLLLMYCSAIFYQSSILEKTTAGWILKVNPVYLMIYNMRRNVIDGLGLDAESMLIGCVFAVISLFIGFAVFYRKQDEFILHI